MGGGNSIFSLHSMGITSYPVSAVSSAQWGDSGWEAVREAERHVPEAGPVHQTLCAPWLPALWVQLQVTHALDDMVAQSHLRKRPDDKFKEDFRGAFVKTVHLKRH